MTTLPSLSPTRLFPAPGSSSILFKCRIEKHGEKGKSPRSNVQSPMSGSGARLSSHQAAARRGDDSTPSELMIFFRTVSLGSSCPTAPHEQPRAELSNPFRIPLCLFQPDQYD